MVAGIRQACHGDISVMNSRVLQGMISWLLMTAVFSAVLTVTTPVSARKITVEAVSVALDPENPDMKTAGRLEFLGGLRLSSPDAAFGGFSGLDISAEGQLSAISDRGQWLSARLEERQNRPVSLSATRMQPLSGVEGRALSGPWRDAESLARLPGGGWLVAFERFHRIRRYAARAPSDGGRAAVMPVPAALSGAPPNGGIEAMTVLDDGRILIFVEDMRTEEGNHPGWLIGADGRMAALSLAATGLFKPTGLATLVNGDVLLLERRFTLIGGVAARISRIRRQDIRPGARLHSRELVRLEPPLTVDNFEGIAAVGDRIYILSDDNFNPLQNTLLLKFRLRP